MIDEYNNFVGKSEGKRPLGRLKRRWEDNIRKEFREVGSKGVDRIHVVEGRDQWRVIVKTLMNIWVP
jgi:ribosome biogenesis protein Nip4